MMKIVKINEDKTTYEQRFIDLMTYCFKMCTAKDFKRDWERSTPERETVLGAFDEEILASCISIPYRSMYIDGKPLKMAGLGGVTTASTYRSGGVCSNLIKEGLKIMHEQGAVYSMLAPFSYEFYEKLGWKWCYNNILYSFEIERLKKFKNEGHIEYVSATTMDELNMFYETYIQKLNGACTREEIHWKRRISRDLDHYTVLYRNNVGTVEGYMIYKITHATLAFDVIEIQYTTLGALRSFLNYICSHSAQVTKVHILAKEHDIILDVLTNPKCNTCIDSYMMGRIIDVCKALKAYEFQKDGSFIIEVNDNTCDWNNGSFKVTVNLGEVDIKEVDDEADLSIDIRELTQLLIGFRNIKELEMLEKIQWKQSKDEIEACFKVNRSKVALYDYF